jgi:hypothetical protein
MKKLTLAIALALAFSCQTAIPYTQIQPPVFPLPGVESVAILDFGVPENNSARIFSDDVLIFFQFKKTREERLYERLARIATLELQGTFNQEQLYKVYTQETVLNPGTRRIEFFTDALVTGNILDFSADRETVYREEENEEGELIPIFETKVTAALELEVRAYSGIDLSLIGQKSFDSSYRKVFPEGAEIPSETEIALDLLDNITRRNFPGLFFKQEVRRFHYLLNSEDEDPAFEEALALAGDGNFRAARELFAEMYQAKGDNYAGYNMALIYEAQGKITQAMQLMDELAVKGFRDSQRQLDRMNRRVEIEGPYWE